MCTLHGFLAVCWCIGTATSILLSIIIVIFHIIALSHTSASAGERPVHTVSIYAYRVHSQSGVFGVHSPSGVYGVHSQSRCLWGPLSVSVSLGSTISLVSMRSTLSLMSMGSTLSLMSMGIILFHTLCNLSID